MTFVALKKISSNSSKILFFSHDADMNAIIILITCIVCYAQGFQTVIFRRTLISTTAFASSAHDTRRTLISTTAFTSFAHDTRRTLINTVAAALTAGVFLSPRTAGALTENDSKSESEAQAALYMILRAQEATLQELRLIKNGMYKDVQRQNIKLAVSYILKNYKLQDNFLQVSRTLSSAKQISANLMANEIVSDLTTILEYFDTQDVQNLKVGSGGASESFVTEGLVSANKKIQQFVDLANADSVIQVMNRISLENELNLKEFPEDILGKLKNPDPRL